MKTTIFVIGFLVACNAVLAATTVNRITSLPGLSSNQFTMYNGYVEINNGKNLFYWFVQSLNNPAEDPVVLWLNGGPGCSSLGGLLAENGPFSPSENGTLILNPYTWALVANMLYLESPAGYKEGSFSDNITAADNHEFLTKWFGLFPQFAQNDFYISGESYAGHFIPTLVDEIYKHNVTQPNIQPQSKFKGFIVGNPSTSPDYDNGDSLFTYYRTHGMIPLNARTYPKDGGFDPYDILSDVCTYSMLQNYIRFPNHMNVRHSKKGRNVPNRPACIEDWVFLYLNGNFYRPKATNYRQYFQRADVQKTLGVYSTKWYQCNDLDYIDELGSMVPYYIKFMNNTNYKMLVYSGDQDTVVNFIGTEQWIYSTGRPIVKDWAPWYYSYDGSEANKQVTGWRVVFDRITFMTVKGSGHMVPWSQPAPSLEMFRNFLFKS